jgi:hypothetical protein
MIMKKLMQKQDLVEFGKEFGLRADWHEPDEQDISITVNGNVFDNAGIWGSATEAPYSCVEHFVTLKHEGKPVAEVNLATLFSWAAESTKPEEPEEPGIKVFPDFWTEYLILQLKEILESGPGMPPFTPVVIHSTMDYVVGEYNNSPYIVARYEDKIRLVNTRGSWILYSISLREAMDELKNNIMERLLSNGPRGNKMIHVWNVLDSSPISVPDPSEIIESAIEDSESGPHGIDWFNVAEELGADPDDVLVDLVRSSIRENDNDTLLRVTDEQLNFDVTDWLSEVFDDNIPTKDLLKLANDIDVELDPDIEEVLKDTDQ